MRFRHARAAPAAPKVSPIEAGERMHATRQAVARAGVVLRANAAGAAPTVIQAVHPVALSSAPIGIPEISRAVADIMAYCAMVSVPWSTALAGAEIIHTREAYGR